MFGGPTRKTKSVVWQGLDFANRIKIGSRIFLGSLSLGACGLLYQASFPIFVLPSTVTHPTVCRRPLYGSEEERKQHTRWYHRADLDNFQETLSFQYCVWTEEVVVYGDIDHKRCSLRTDTLLSERAQFGDVRGKHQDKKRALQPIACQSLESLLDGPLTVTWSQALIPEVDMYEGAYTSKNYFLNSIKGWLLLVSSNGDYHRYGRNPHAPKLGQSNNMNLLKIEQGMESIFKKVLSDERRAWKASLRGKDPLECVKGYGSADATGKHVTLIEGSGVVSWRDHLSNRLPALEAELQSRLKTRWGGIFIVPELPDSSAASKVSILGDG